MKPCKECEGAGRSGLCKWCDGTGECLDCDCGHPHDCGRCGGEGYTDEKASCRSCAGCGSEEALKEWREKQAKAALSIATQKALCEAAAASTHHAPISWDGGTLVLRGIPLRAARVLFSNQLCDEERGEVRVVLFAKDPPESWVKATLAKVERATEAA